MDYVTHQDVYGTPSLYDVLEKEYVDAHKDEWREEGIKEGIKEGIEQGLQQGIEKGIEQGALQKAREMAKSMLADHIPIERIIAYTGLSEAEIKSL